MVSSVSNEDIDLVGNEKEDEHELVGDEKDDDIYSLEHQDNIEELCESNILVWLPLDL